MNRLTVARLSLLALLPALSSAQPLSKSVALDFFRDVSSNNLKGLATRSDGRLLAGPVLTDLAGPAVNASILWRLEPAGDGKWLVATGPDGKIFEATIDAAKGTFTSREVADLEESQVFTVKRLPDGAILAGTSPVGALSLVRDGKLAARIILPVDSIFDAVLLPPKAGSKSSGSALIATGNPGRVYQIDLDKFSAGGVSLDKIADPKTLAEKGVVLLGEIRDRNARRLALLGDHVIVGSSPKGNVYKLALRPAASTPPASTAPTAASPSAATPTTTPAPLDAVLLQENRDAEVAELWPQPNGDFYAAIVFSNQQAESRLNRPAPAKPAVADGAPAGDGKPEGPAATPGAPATPPPAPDRFPGRSTIVHFPKNGFPETVVSRANLAFYALAVRGDTLLIAGGEQGDVLGYDLKARQSLTYAGTASAQVSQIAPIPGANAARYLLLRNNAPGFALLDFAAAGVREAETRRIDLGSLATLGALRFAHLRDVDPTQIGIEIRTSLSSDEAEGWTPWVTATFREDGWFAPDARGRFLKARLKLPAAAHAAQLDEARAYFLPQNRRPLLAEFRIAAPNYAMIPPGESSGGSPVTTLGSLLSTADRERSSDERRRPSMSSTVFPQPGMQLVTWSVSDPDGDDLRATFSIRREGTDTWTDLAIDSAEGFAQFDTSHLPDGVYFTRVVVTEQAPRAAADRLSTAFETDQLVVDKAPPAILDTKLARDGDSLLLVVNGRDAASLLEGAEFVFNNGYREQVLHPADGIRDSRAESFELRVPAEKISAATSVEILLYDEPGNNAAVRLPLPKK